MFSRLFMLLVCSLIILTHSKKSKDGEKPDWAKKDIRDFTDADMERLLDQWEEDEEPLEEDELPEHLRPLPKIDMTKLDPGDPEGLLQVTKKGRTLMTFVSVSGNPTREESEAITKLWQTSLWNNHIQAEKIVLLKNMNRYPFQSLPLLKTTIRFHSYMVDDNRAIFLFKDGSQAWIAKDYLVEQERCESVTIENKVYPGKHSTGSKDKAKEEL